MVLGKDARNAKYHDRIGTTPHHFVFEKPENVSKFRAFGCKAFMYLNEDRREKGKHLPRAAEALDRKVPGSNPTQCHLDRLLRKGREIQSPATGHKAGSLHRYGRGQGLKGG